MLKGYVIGEWDRMTENKRFTTNGYKIYDTFHDGTHWLVNQVEANEIVDKMNNLDSKARERSKALSKLQKENEQLKQRNNRQCEQLGRLYNLIEQKDWRALNDILDDFKKCEEQLQKEWGTYGDVK